ncbi:TonB-dependent receptor domain-containing protein [Sphingomonas beigongshangi]|uniref:TonB-dependent receptor domain-containing protein n=1 Tax=Sphingomonas beigongshangi TaxID=2782540 RepID=UPI001AED6B87|nr:TonB-dependent receptor [Sphingomonas beigongshangi]
MTRTTCYLLAWSALLGSAPALAQQDGGASPPAEGTSEIVVRARRVSGSAIGDAEPIAVLDAAAIRTLGATTIKDLMQRLQGLTTGANGGPPVFLLNGRRVASMDDVYGLPPEAMERTEILTEQDAARFGFPPTQRVVNFITKKNFRSIVAENTVSGATDGGNGTDYLFLNTTRLSGSRRLTINTSYQHQDAIRQSQRNILPDPTALYALAGNVAAVGGGSIDAALDRLVGRAVAVAALPADNAARQQLGSYLATADRPAVTDIGRFRTLLPTSDTLAANTTLAGPLGRTLSGSVTLSMEATRSAGSNGLATTALRVPGGGTLPFAGDTLVYRYLPDVVLAQRNASLKLSGSGAVQGGIGRWAWTVTGGYNRLRATGLAEQGVPTAALQAAVLAGADPLTPIDASSASRRIAQRQKSVTDETSGKATLNGPLAHLPAGDVLITAAADYTRSANRNDRIDGPAAALTRTVKSGSINATVPVAAAKQGVLPFLGDLSLNGTLGVSDVSRYGRLFQSAYGVSWSLRPRFQLHASVNETQTAPAIALLTNPVLTTPNVPFFDFATGTSGLVTAVTGGNPALTPERRRVSELGLAYHPIRDDRGSIRLAVDYIETRIADQTTNLAGATPPIQAAFPDLFLRDGTGRLTQVDLRGVNVARETERKLQFVTAIWTQIGKKPAPAAAQPGVPAKDAPPPTPPKEPIHVFSYVTTTLRLSDRAVLRDGLASLDLLDGATLNGSGGRPRWEVGGNLGLTVGALNIGTFIQAQGATRVRSLLATSDLTFSGKTIIGSWTQLDLDKMPHKPWSKSLSLNLLVQNWLNDRIDVRDRNGATPNGFQPGYLDPIGRTVQLGVRKLF